MKRPFKIVAWILGALALLLTVAAVALTLLFDPNDYRDEIGAVVKRQTGRELTIVGNLKLSVFPWLGVDVGETLLSNATGFGPAPFARIEHAKVKVRLLPLLRRQVELGELELTGLRLNLARDASGRSNWEDLTKPSAQTPPPPEGAPQEKRGMIGLRLGGMEITDADVSWEDKTKNQQAEISHLNLQTGEIDVGTPVNLSLDTDFSLNSPRLAGHLTLKGRVHQNTSTERYGVEGLALDVTAQGEGLPGKRAQLSVAGDATADLKAQTAEFRGLRIEGYGARAQLDGSAKQILSKAAASGKINLEVKDGNQLAQLLAASLPQGFKPGALTGASLESSFDADLATERAALKGLLLKGVGMQVHGEAEGSQILSKPAFAGRVKIDEFVPRDALETLGITPPTSDSKTLTKATFSSRFDVGADHAAVDELLLRLDQSTVKGRVAAQRLSPLVLRYDLNIDQIDVDRYLPPPSKEKAQPPPATEAATAPLKLPLEQLRALDIDGTLRVGQLKAANMRSTAIVAPLRATGGRFALSPSAKLYEGAYAGNLGLDVRSDTPLLSMDEKLTGVQIGPLLKDFMGKDYVTGKAQLGAKLTARGTEVADIRRTLNGNASFAFENGTIKELDILQLLLDDYAKYLRQNPPKEEGRKQTDFTQMRGTASVKDGLITNKDLSLTSPALRIAGKGSASLVTQKVDYRLDTTVIATKGTLAQLQGKTVPITIGGTFSKLSFGVDVAAALQKQVQKRLEEEGKKQQKKLEKELQKGLEGLFKKK